jgi:hypothetical protein
LVSASNLLRVIRGISCVNLDVATDQTGAHSYIVK